MEQLLTRTYAQLNHHLEWLKAQKSRENEEIEKNRTKK